MTYTSEPCRGRCGFCPQGHVHNSKQAAQLSRVQWPDFGWDEFFTHLETTQNAPSSPDHPKFGRICFQVLNYAGFFEELVDMIIEIHQRFPKLHISAAVPPIPKDQLATLHEAGLERIGIAVDACTPDLFKKIKGDSIEGPYHWNNHWNTLKAALEIFGKGYATTHFIVGLGESEEELIRAMEQAVKMRILPAIFLFTPVKGTPMEKHPRPDLSVFRRIQLARFFLLKDSENFTRFYFKNGRLHEVKNLTALELTTIIENGFAFKTAGCPDCNRPFYTSRPGEEPDGFPRNLTKVEEKKVFSDLEEMIPTKK